MTKTAKPCSISMPFELDVICRKFCDSYHIKYSELIRKALLSYLSIKNSEWTEGFKLYGRLKEIEDIILIARTNRNQALYDGSGLEEIRGLRVEGTREYAMKTHYGNGMGQIKKGQIKNEVEREIYDKYSRIIYEYNQERIKILLNPIYIKWLTTTLRELKENSNEQLTQDT